MVCVVLMETMCVSASYIPPTPSVADSSGSDGVMYTNLKNNLYSSVSHITFTHQPRFVDRLAPLGTLI